MVVPVLNRDLTNQRLHTLVPTAVGILLLSLNGVLSTVYQVALG